MRSSRPRAALAAAVVAAVLVAGCASTGGDDGGHAHDDAAAPIDGAREIAVTASSMAFAPHRLQLDAGEPINVALHSDDILHDLTIDEVDFHIAARAGETVTGGLVIDRPGTYTAYCSVPGHRRAGMELEIVVR